MYHKNLRFLLKELILSPLGGRATTWHAGCGILVPSPGIKPMPAEVEARSPNHGTAREFPNHILDNVDFRNFPFKNKRRGLPWWCSG